MPEESVLPHANRPLWGVRLPPGGLRLHIRPVRWRSGLGDRYAGDLPSLVCVPAEMPILWVPADPEPVASVNDTAKVPLDLQHHGARSVQGAVVGVAQRVGARATAARCIFPTGQVVSRSPTAFDD